VVAEARGLGLEILYLGDLEASGRGVAADFAPRPPSPEDLCTICYTSGTTGTPKGVMLSHRAILASASAALRMLQAPQRLGKGPLVPLQRGAEAYLSYLPLAHIFERVVMVAMITMGAKVGFYQGDVLKLMDDLAALRPTIFVSVPRLFNRVYDKVMAGVKEKGAVAQWLLAWAFDAKLEALRRDGLLTHWLYDRLVFSAIRERLGGRVKVMITGSAPLAGKVMDFLRVVFSCHVLEGYGMTETSAVSCLTCPGDLYCPQLGVPSPCVEAKLVDIPEMGYTTRDSPRPRGEIWIRGASCFSGYYRSPERTAEALTPDGWVVTGDVGEWDEAGRLLMIDRRKCLFKLAQGEYVSPERVEAVLARHPLVAQAFVEGNSLKASLVAVVVPDVPRLRAWYAQLSGGECGGMDLPALLARDPSIPALLARELGQALGSRGSGELKGFEVPRALHLEAEAFSVENGLLTPTFKLKRSVAKAKYAPVLSTLYEALE
jgi:long-chain acyl-CoA synthetase